VTRSELPPPVRAVAAALRQLRTSWAIAGGWAIDLALGRVTRPHADVAAFRDAQGALRAALPAWEFRAAVGGALVPWPPDARLAPPSREVHARLPAGDPAPALEFLLNERDGADWVYRRDPAVRLPATRAIRAAPGGVPVLAPEIVLLYKSKAPRPRDEHDFRAAQPLLDSAARAWLRDALRRAEPGHAWADALTPDR
jgi:hypothetical protein